MCGGYFACACWVCMWSVGMHVLLFCFVYQSLFTTCSMGPKKEEMLRLSVIPAILYGYFGRSSFALFRKLELEIFHQSFGF